MFNSKFMFLRFRLMIPYIGICLCAFVVLTCSKALPQVASGQMGGRDGHKLLAQNGTDSAKELTIAAEVRFVASGMEASRVQIKKASCVLTRHQVTPIAIIQDTAKALKELGAPPSKNSQEQLAQKRDREETITTWWAKDDDRVSEKVLYNPYRNGILRSESLLRIPGTDSILSEYISRRTSNPYHFGQLNAQEDNNFDTLLQDGMNDPRYYAFYWGRYPIAKILTKSTGNSDVDAWPLASYKGEENVQGGRCFKIQQPMPDSEGSVYYWVDVEHGFVVRQIETYLRIDAAEVLIEKVEVPQLIESKGFWLPVKALAKVYPHFSWKQPVEQRVFRLIEVEIQNIELPNLLSPDTFQLTWPLNTNVTDTISGRDFVVAKQPLGGTAPTTQSQKTSSPLRAEDDPTIQIALAQPTVKVGQAAPDFIATDMNGKIWKLSDLKGHKNLLLTFFPKCFTGGCANHLSSLRDKQKEFDARNVQILAVSVDSAEGEKGQKAFAQQLQLSFPLISDTSRALSKLFGAAQNDKQTAARMSIFIDKEGVVRWVDTDVHIVSHGADVLAKIQGL